MHNNKKQNDTASQHRRLQKGQKNRFDFCKFCFAFLCTSRARRGGHLTIGIPIRTNFYRNATTSTAVMTTGDKRVQLY
jgi:hypothetical protein